MSGPIVQKDYRLVQGDGWDEGWALSSALDGTPYLISGWSADFSLRLNYGDPTALIAMTSSAPSANGSTVAVVESPGTSLLASTEAVVAPADTMLLIPLMAAKQAKYYYTWRIISPTSVPRTVAIGAWYVTART